LRRLDQRLVGSGQGELFALGDGQMQSIAAAQRRAVGVLQPGPGLQEIAGTGFQQLQAFAAEAFEFGVDRGGPLSAQITPPHAKRHHTRDFHEQPVAYQDRCLSLEA
jgi:hypothetical protein